MYVELCTWIMFLLITVGSLGNILCICVFLRKRFRSSALTPFFVALLIADCIYLTFRVVKLVYYQGTMFDDFLSRSSCSSTFFIRIYEYFAQNASQIFIPLCHYELYLRFSLILMSSLATQRAYDMCRLSFRLIKQNSSSRLVTFILIFNAFILAYIMEFLGLSIFCSTELSTKTAYQWYDYLRNNLSNETIVLTNFIRNQSRNGKDLDCIMNDTSSCSQDEIAHTVRHYFDIHQRSIVLLIHKIEIATVGTKMPRNELRLKYHYHTCLFPFQSDTFLNLFDILYSRILGLNRYTTLLVVGSIIPSIITILANAISLRWILNIRNSVHKQTFILRRTDETRRVILIITIECLLGVMNSWLVDIILSVKFCKRSVAIGDDCPDFLRRYHPLLFFFDMLNSMSNIFLYCFATRRFRHELERMLTGWFYTIRKRFACDWKYPKLRRNTSDDDQYIVPTEFSLQLLKSFKRRSTEKYDYIEFKLVDTPS